MIPTAELEISAHLAVTTVAALEKTTVLVLCKTNTIKQIYFSGLEKNFRNSDTRMRLRQT